MAREPDEHGTTAGRDAFLLTSRDYRGGLGRLKPDVLVRDGERVVAVIDAKYKRTSGLVRRSADLIMMVEAPNPNWHDPADSSVYPGNRLKRLAGRHGKKFGPGGSQAYTNMAFFDGHVSMFDTQKFQASGAPATFRCQRCPGIMDPDWWFRA